MMGHKEPMKGGLEYDAFTGWRRVLIWRAGQRKRTKQAFSRRVRRRRKRELQLKLLEIQYEHANC